MPGFVSQATIKACSLKGDIFITWLSTLKHYNAAVVKHI